MARKIANRGKAPVLIRNQPYREEKPTILIVCEGKNTEPSYLKQFRLSSATIKPIGEGYVTVSLVERSKYLKPYGLIYEGKNSKIITEEIFNLLDGIDTKTGKERKILAINRAKRNYNLFDHKNPASEESSTTVFKLIEELMKYI